MITQLRRRLGEQPILFDSALLFIKALVAAAAGAGFWLVAARLQPPEVVGVAGALISASLALSFFSQLGLNFSLVSTMPRSATPASDVAASLVVVAGCGVVLGAGFALVAPRLSPSLTFLGASPALVTVFAVLVAGSAAGLLTDSAYLVLRAVPSNLAINGLVSGVLRCALPFLLVGLGAFGLFASVGLALTVAAALSAVVLLRRLPRPDRWLVRPTGSSEVARLAGAGYVTSALDMVPILFLPLLVINGLGAHANGVFFICFQVAMLLNALVLAVAMSMLAEGSRHPERASAISRRSGVIMGAGVAAAVGVMLPLSHFVLSVFGADYAALGTSTLVVLCLGAFGVALHNWTLMRLRIAHELRSTMVMQAVACVTVIGLAAVGSSFGLVWVAVGWGLGHLAGGLVGCVAVFRLVPRGSDTRWDLVLPEHEVAS